MAPLSPSTQTSPRLNTACFEAFSSQDHQLFELLVSCHLDLRTFAARANQSISHSLRWISQPHISSAIKVLRDFDLESLEALTLSTRLRCMPALHTLLERIGSCAQSLDDNPKPVTPNDLSFIRALTLIARFCGFKSPPSTPLSFPTTKTFNHPIPQPTPRTTTTLPPVTNNTPSTPHLQPTPKPETHPEALPEPHISDEDIQRLLIESLPASMVEEINQTGLARDLYHIWKRNEQTSDATHTSKTSQPSTATRINTPDLALTSHPKQPLPQLPTHTLQPQRRPPARASPISNYSPRSGASGLLNRVGTTS